MRSKTSFFNKTLFKKNLSRYWPLWGLASFAGALVPLTLLLQILRNPDLGMISWEDVEVAYYTVLTVVVPIASLLYAVVCGAAVWSYLYNPRSTGMMHRLPIRREGLFVTSFLSGMAMMLIPYAITGTLTILLTLFTGSMAWKAMAVTILGVLGESFFYFSSATLAAFLTGNIFAMPVLYFLLHFLHPLVTFLIRVLQSSFYYGVPGSYIHAGEWLCPTVYLISNTQIRYVRSAETAVIGDRQYEHRVIVGAALEKGWLIGVYALVGVGLLALAWLLYRRRHSENAGDVAAVKMLRPVFRYAGALLAGLAGGLLLYSLVWRPFQSHYDVIEALPLLVCMIIVGLIGYYGVSMLLEKSLKVFRGSLPGAALTAALLAVTCGVFRFDFFGVESRVPSAQEVEALEIWTNGDHLRMEAGRDDALLAQALDLHQAIVSDLDYIQIGDDGTTDTQMNTTYTHISMTYHLVGGETVDRNYNLWLREDRMAQPDTYDCKLDQLVNSTEALLLELLPNENQRVLNGELRDRDYTVSIPLLPQEAQALLEAVAWDAANGTWGRENWFNQELGEEFASVDLQLEDTRPDQEHRLDYRYLILRPEMTETIQTLRQLGLLAQDSLTLVNPYRERSEEDQEYQFTVNGEAVEQIPVEETVGGAVTGSLGVIGGADGPTAVYVTGG